MRREKLKADGALRAAGRLRPCQRERGQPLGFNQWQPDRLAAWLAAFNVGLVDDGPCRAVRIIDFIPNRRCGLTRPAHPQAS